jgi:serine/threonine protein kinase
MVHEATKEVIEVQNYKSDMYYEILLEIEVMVLLEHPRIVNIVGWGLPCSECNQIRVGRKFMDNGSLEDVLVCVKEGNVPSWWTHDNISIVIIDIVVGLRYAHSEHVIHGDINPMNIFLDSEHHACIGNFGRTRIDDQENEGKHETSVYHAPECTSVGVLSKKVDVYAFGIVLHEILASGRDKDGKTGDFRTLIHPDVQKIINECRSLNPDDRPEFDDIFNRLHGIELPFHGVHKNLSEEAKSIKMMAEAGDLDYQLIYAGCLERGEEFDRDLKEACKYFKLSMESGDPMGKEGYDRCIQMIEEEKSKKKKKKRHVASDALITHTHAHGSSGARSRGKSSLPSQHHPSNCTLC